MGALLPLLSFAAINALAQLGLYVHHLAGLRASALVAPTVGATTLFVAWTLAATTALAVLLVGAGALECRLGRREAPVWTERFALVLMPALLFLMIVDTQVYGLLGVHLYSPVTRDALGNAHVGRELVLGTSTAISLAAFALAAIALEYGLLRLCRRVAHAPRKGTARAAAGALIGAQLLATVTAVALHRPQWTGSDRHIVDGMPAYDLVFGAEGFDPADVLLRYPGPQATPPPRLLRRPDILFVQVESLRADAFDPAVTPSIVRFLAENPCVTSAQHFSGGHTTEYGTFSLLYGLDSYHYDPLARAPRPAWPLEVLRANGYRISGASASGLRDWNDAGFMVAQLDGYEEFLDGTWEGDRELVRWLRRQSEARDGDQPTFTFLFLNGTHHNYHYPPEYERFTPVMPPDYDHFMGDDRLAESSERIVNRYRNALTWLDATFAEILTVVDARRTVIVLTGDHGEEFWEHGLLGHAASTFVNERIQVPLAICLPGGPRLRVARSSHVDVWPTILEHLSTETEPPTSAWTNGVSLLGPLAPDRLMIVGGLDFPYRSRTACVIGGGAKHHVELCSSRSRCLRPYRTTALDDTVTHPAGDASGAAPLVRELQTRMGRFLEFPGE